MPGLLALIEGDLPSGRSAWRSSAPGTATAKHPAWRHNLRKPTRRARSRSDDETLGVPRRGGRGRAARADLERGAAHLPGLRHLREARRAAADLRVRPPSGLGPSARCRRRVRGVRLIRVTESPAFRALSDAVLAIAAECAVEPVPPAARRLARELAGRALRRARHPRRRGRVRPLHDVGDERGPDRADRAAAAHARPARGDARVARRSAWPTSARTRASALVAVAHPDMRSFLGVPIVARGRVIGAFYLTDKDGGGEFSTRTRG